MRRHDDDGTPDRRYAFAREWCGYKEPRYVARFCGSWIGQAITRAGAVVLADTHHAVMMAPYTTTGAP